MYERNKKIRMIHIDTHVIDEQLYIYIYTNILNKSLMGNIDIAVPVGIRSLFSLVIVTTSEISASPLHGYKDVQNKKKKRFLQVSNYTV